MIRQHHWEYDQPMRWYACAPRDLPPLGDGDRCPGGCGARVTDYQLVTWGISYLPLHVSLDMIAADVTVHSVPV